MNNRKFKFRVYSVFDKSFHYFDIYEGCPSGIYGGVSEPQQFTGLKDKNGKEIYEGDIVQTVDNHECKIGIHWVEYDRGIIKWLREGFCVCQEMIGSNELHHYATCHCCPCGLEVIGNIFENPELVHKITV